MRQAGSRGAIESVRLDPIPDVTLTNSFPLNVHQIQEFHNTDFQKYFGAIRNNNRKGNDSKIHNA